MSGATEWMTMTPQELSVIQAKAMRTLQPFTDINPLALVMVSSQQQMMDADKHPMELDLMQMKIRHGGLHCDTNCSGVRDADFAKHSPNTADTPANFVCGSCLTGTGPCGRQVHCQLRRHVKRPGILLIA